MAGAAGHMILDHSRDGLIPYPRRKRLSSQESLPHEFAEFALYPAAQRHGESLLGPVHETLRQPPGECFLENVLVTPERRELVSAREARRELDELMIKKGRSA